ncbi:ABC transporter ATP-binding protein [Paenibacillus mendelii]|uniref:ABC transporter ATP-binding protein n=1 Tax=Paenibacillus mendelii TaxID=206163 RepID=A0ABV6J965_9BACL|nr:ABC transporter ATP-binding protein [Paenibacillus mendelii]MCQ6559665.1 ABC transporter ATP-binding protein [Paenibacillus mendelii]
MKPVLEVQNLTGGYSPRRPVLHGLSFEVEPGEMVGLIGLNGAGKSTAIKHILGLMQPHEGEVRVQGQTLDQDPGQYRSAITYVPETPLLFDELTVEEHLRLTGMAYDVEESRYSDRTTGLLDDFYMTPKRRAFAAHLSKGMRQKVMIMNALLARPPLYIIDEPFLGLDPLGIRSLLDKLVEVKQEGAAIFMSSHILSTVETYCDRFIVLHHGKIIAQGTLQDIRSAAGMQREQGTLEEAFYRLTTDGGSHGG